MAAVLAQEWPDLPPAGPVTPATLKQQLGIADAADDAFVDRITLAVNRKVRRWPIGAYGSQPDVAPGDRVWPGDLVEGAMMLAVRLFRRRNSPAGVEAFGAEGALYVQRNDPDIAMLLELGAYAGPQVG